ncbi:MAG: hypothetical protein H8E44_07260 [Planctomycetes bacterium]|nr:hypothetical protein [Planctomycetota bacterium]
MADPVIVDVAEAMVAAIETERDADGFETAGFEPDWDFAGRAASNELQDNDIHVTVFVPRKYELIDRVSRTELEYVVKMEIDIRQKLGQSSQNEKGEIDRDELRLLSMLTEQIHVLFFTNQRLTAGSNNALWIPTYEGISAVSEIATVGSFRDVRETREFYGLCFEVFQVTA